MKKSIIASALVLSCVAAIAQPAKPTYSYYEGFNLSMGLGENATTETVGSNTFKAKSVTTVAKANYTFALAYPAKLGLTATMDLKNSNIDGTDTLAISAPTELTVEPGVLLLSNSLVYLKLGSYASRFESGANASRNLSGTSYGIGFKHYIHGQNFIQIEWTERAPSATSGLPDTKFKQISTAVLVGFNF